MANNENRSNGDMRKDDVRKDAPTDRNQRPAQQPDRESRTDFSERGNSQERSAEVNREKTKQQDRQDTGYGQSSEPKGNRRT